VTATKTHQRDDLDSRSAGEGDTKPTATIGERFEYIITVPATPTSVPRTTCGY